MKMFEIKVLAHVGLLHNGTYVFKSKKEAYIFSTGLQEGLKSGGKNPHQIIVKEIK